jgi:hypothetical protein
MRPVEMQQPKSVIIEQHTKDRILHWREVGRRRGKAAHIDIMSPYPSSSHMGIPLFFLVNFYPDLENCCFFVLISALFSLFSKSTIGG